MNDIRHISSQELVDFLLNNGEKKFRAAQIEEWLWKKGARSFDEMTNLSVALRQKLQENFTFLHADIATCVQSSDGTAKFIFGLHDGKQVEGVLIPSGQRVTACISSQVGCALKCAFCATGTMGFIRNLHSTEIFDQFMLMDQKAQELYSQNITNIVYMGMGEPLMNYENVMASIQRITAPTGPGLSPSRITLSTVGIAAGIKRLADDGFISAVAATFPYDTAAVGTLICRFKRNQFSEPLTADILDRPFSCFCFGTTAAYHLTGCQIADGYFYFIPAITAAKPQKACPGFFIQSAYCSQFSVFLTGYVFDSFYVSQTAAALYLSGTDLSRFRVKLFSAIAPATP